MGGTVTRAAPFYGRVLVKLALRIFFSDGYLSTMVDTFSAQRAALVSEARQVGIQSLCLVKRSWALLESNPTRDNQARAGECSRAGLGRDMAAEAWSFPNIHLPCHASQNSPPLRRKGLTSYRCFLEASRRAGDGGFRAFVVAQGQQPPSIRVGIVPSPIPYALRALGKPGEEAAHLRYGESNSCPGVRTARFPIPTRFTEGFCGRRSFLGFGVH